MVQRSSEEEEGPSTIDLRHPPSALPLLFFSLTMENPEQHHHSLNALLDDFTTPDQAVQQLNLKRLEALAEDPSSTSAVLSIICDVSWPNSQRLAAATIARQLLRREASSSSAIPFGHISTSRGEVVKNLIFASIDAGGGDDGTSSRNVPLQRAIGGVIAAFFHNMQEPNLDVAVVGEVWGVAMSELRTALPPTPSTRGSPRVAASIASVTRVLCEEVLAISSCHAPLRAWVSGSAEQSTLLCSLFYDILSVLLSFCHAAPLFQNSAAPTLQWAVESALLRDVMSSVAVCLKGGILPAAPRHHFSAEDGTAAQAVQSVMAAVEKVHHAICAVLTEEVLLPFHQLTRTVDPTTPLADYIHAVSPFIVAGSQYMEDLLPVEALEGENTHFSTLAFPPLITFWRAAALTIDIYEGVGEPTSPHSAILASLSYAAELVNTTDSFSCNLGNSGCGRGGNNDALSQACLADLLTALHAVCRLPMPDSATWTEECTVQIPDTSAEVLVVAPAGRKRQCDDAAAHNQHHLTEDGEVREKEERTMTVMSNAVEAALPDNGSVRRGVAWFLNCLTFNANLHESLSAQLLSSSELMLLRSGLSTAPVDVEAALFIWNEIVEELLSAVLGGRSSAATSRNVREAVLLILGHVSLWLNSVSATPPPPSVLPFYVRIAAIRFLTQSAATLISEAACKTEIFDADTATALLRAMGGVESIPFAMAHHLAGEVNKAVQLECLQGLTVLLSIFLESLSTAAAGEVSTDSDSDEEINDGVPLAACQKGAVTDYLNKLHISDGINFVTQATVNVGNSLPHLQWAGRQAVYRLLGRVVPLLPPTSAWFPDSSLHHVLPPLLETLARHYMQLIAAAPLPLLEMASLLSCVGDLLHTLDGKASSIDTLSTALPWILQVSQHVLDQYDAHCCAAVATSAAGPPETGVDMEDMSTVGIDLLSCVSDAWIDRDACLVGGMDELTQQMASISQLASSLLLQGAPTGSGEAVSLSSRCLTLLSHCQTRFDHPSRTVASMNAATEVEVRSTDRTGDIRRACFAVLYDSAYLLIVSSDATAPLPLELFITLSTRCLDEVHQHLKLDCNELLGNSCNGADAPRSVREQHGSLLGGNVAAANAFLCLSEVVYLWNQQQQRLFIDGGQSFCQQEAILGLVPHFSSLFELMIRALHQSPFPVDYVLRQNIRLSIASLGSFLFGSPSPAPSASISLSLFSSPLAMMDAVLSVLNSHTMHSFASGLGEGDVSGISEAIQLLYGLGTFLHTAFVSSVDETSTLELLRRHGKDLTRTVLWMQRCGRAINPSSDPRCTALLRSFPTPKLLLQLWRPPIHSLLQAHLQGVLVLSMSQLHQLRELASAG